MLFIPVRQGADTNLVQGLSSSTFVEALEDQLARNLLMQLDRNWRALSPDDAPVYLRLSNVSSYRQIEAVRRLMSDVLGADRAQVLSLGPRSAELVFQGPLSAGALQERLAAVPFDGFRLEPVEVRRDRVELRVARIGPAAAAAARPR